MESSTPKQRMLSAYRGQFADRVAIAPEFWYYYPAKLLKVDMIEFSRQVPFHQALKKTFETFGCDGWGVTFPGIPNPRVTGQGSERWLDDQTLESHHVTRTPHGDLTSGWRGTRAEPGWTIERPLKDLARDLPAWECARFGGDVSAIDWTRAVRAWEEVGESYLLECWVGVPFFDFWAGDREGGFETGIFDLADPDLEPMLLRYRERYIEQVCQVIRSACEHTPFEAFCIGCTWSCNSLLGPHLWRKWDKPLIAAVAAEVHRHGRLLHVHLHGRCRETVPDLAELGLDCVCPFERPPGGDIVGLTGLQEVAQHLRGVTTMNGNVHTVETLIRRQPADARREVREIMTAFAGNPRVIIGTGDQVGRETPEENLHALIEEARTLSPGWRDGTLGG